MSDVALPWQISLLKRQILPDIGGCSAVEWLPSRQQMALISDDRACLWLSDAHLQQFEPLPLIPSEEQTLHQTEKAYKPDFEAMTALNWEGQEGLLVFGSGSKAARERALWIDLEQRSVRRFWHAADYRALRRDAGLTRQPQADQDDPAQGYALNIEAAAVHDQQLYLFPRGQVEQHHGVALFDPLDLADGLPVQRQRGRLQLQTPVLGSVPAGISGAASLAQTPYLLLTASAEDTGNSYDDGQVSGSLIGLFNTLTGEVQWQPLRSATGEILPLKVEGITVLHATTGLAMCLLVTDSDGQASEALWLMLKY